MGGDIVIVDSEPAFIDRTFPPPSLFVLAPIEFERL